MKTLTAVALATITTLISAQTGTRPAKPQNKRYAARHILIPWKGAMRAPADIKRTRKAAREKADAIVKQLRLGADFAELARTQSSCPSSADGGYLGQFRPGGMIREFEEAVDKSKVGAIIGPVETKFGWHIIQRLRIEHPWPDKIACAHILIAYKGAQRAQPNVSRTKAEAAKLAKELCAELRGKKIDWTKTAKDKSDDRFSGGRGGDLGQGPPERFFAKMTDALAALKVGGISDPVETPLGFHILKRTAIVKPMRASHILIPWKGASRAPADITRTRKEARQLALDLLAKLKTGGADFGLLAKQNSSCPSRASGGDLGEFTRGKMVAEFEKAVQNAKVGEIVGPVETIFGYHIIKRTQ